jgi:hypothetical protein
MQPIARRSPLRSLRGALILGLLAGAPLGVAPLGVVRAQDAAAADTGAMTDEERAAEARRLFAAGVAASGEHEMGVAEERFRAALALRDAPAIRYNLASVLYERGLYPEADALARSAAADPTAAPDIVEHSNTIVGEIAAAAAFVHLDVIASGEVTVTIDGWVIPDTSAEIPVSPGRPHDVVASSGSFEISREEFTLAQGEHRTFAVDALGPESAEEDLEDETEEPVASSGGRPLVEEPLLWVGVGAGVVVVTAVIVGIAVGASGTESPIQGNFMPGVISW